MEDKKTADQLLTEKLRKTVLERLGEPASFDEFAFKMGGIIKEKNIKTFYDDYVESHEETRKFAEENPITVFFTLQLVERGMGDLVRTALQRDPVVESGDFARMFQAPEGRA